MVAPGFTEDWFPQTQRDALGAIVSGVEHVAGMIVEIGAWEGRSTVTMANATRRTIHTCDTWLGSEGEASRLLAEGRNVFAKWQANVDAYTAGNVKPYRMDWRDFLPKISSPVALAFIDAEHTEEAVRSSIELLLPHMSPGGVICGDDAHDPHVRAGVYAVLDEDAVFVANNIWVWQKPATLAERYAAHCITPSDIYLHLPKMVELVKMTNAQHVIELGTRGGVSTVAWLYGLQSTGGRLTSVDLDPAPVIGDPDSNWTHLVGDDLSIEVLDALDPADVVFIDTSHHYRHTRDELEAYLPLVKPGGVIVLHDTALEWPGGAPRADGPFPVRRAVDEFCAAHGFEWENNPECFGLGIIHVPNAGVPAKVVQDA